MNLIPGAAPQGAPDTHQSPRLLGLEIRTGSDQPADDDAADSSKLVTVRGEIDMDNARQLVEAITRVAGTAVVDLRGVTFIDSSGLQGLLQAQEAARQRGDDLILRQPSRSVRRVLERTGLIDRFTVET
jgi:stage II sporulation protein AA (anti-sigma F factor antagonist)